MATVTTSFVLDRSALHAYLTGPSGPALAAAMRVGNRVLNRARQLCPVDEGRLRASLTMVVVQTAAGPIVRVGSNLAYARFVHEGTGIYGPRHTYIRPVHAKALRWPAKNNSGVGRRRFQGGATAAYVYAKRSKGSPPRPFLLNALRQAL